MTSPIGMPREAGSELLGTFTPPSDPELAAAWAQMMAAGRALIESIQTCAPKGQNRAEAVIHVQRAMSVANGAFHTRREGR